MKQLVAAINSSFPLTITAPLQSEACKLSGRTGPAVHWPLLVLPEGVYKTLLPVPATKKTCPLGRVRDGPISHPGPVLVPLGF